jgi:riboflavin-specific deaminase-like protein
MNRPFVYLNMASSVDGKITSSAREYPKMTSRHDRESMDRLRAEADAILVGARSIRDDNPMLHVRSERMQQYRRSLSKPDSLLRVLVTSSLQLDPESRFFEEPGERTPIIATVERAPATRLAALEGKAEIWQLGRERVDLSRLLERLKERGVERLLAEGGGILNWALIEQDLVDELYVTIAPTLLGGQEAPTMIEGAGLSMADQRRLKLVDLHREGDELYLHYAVDRSV